MIPSRWSSRRLVALVTVVFAALCAVPYVTAAARPHPGKTFTGLLVNPYDQHYYLAAQRSAAEHLSRANRFTAEKGAPGPVSRVYPIMGQVGSVTKASAILLYHLPRIVSSLALPFLLLALMRLAFPGRLRTAFAAVVLALFTVGIGTLAPGVFGHPLGGDNIPEATILWSVVVFPHFAVAYVGITLALIAIILALRPDRGRTTILTGLSAGLLLSLSHAFLFLPVGLTLGATAAVAGWRCVRAGAPWSGVTRLASVGAAIFLPALPFLLAFRSEMQDFERLQGRPFPSTPSDTPWTWAAGYVLLLPFVIVGLVVLVRKTWRAGAGRPATPEVDSAALGVLFLALTVWTTLIFLPVTPFQRRFSEGVVIPLAALAGLGLTSLVRRESVVLVPLACCSIVGIMRIAAQGEYVPDSYWSVFRQINEHDVVLAGNALASVLPAYSPGAAYVARTTETIRYADKDRIRRSFLDDPNSSDVLARLSAGGVTLVLADAADTEFNVPVASLNTDCYRPAFQFGSVTGYRLHAGCSPGY